MEAPPEIMERDRDDLQAAIDGLLDRLIAQSAPIADLAEGDRLLTAVGAIVNQVLEAGTARALRMRTLPPAFAAANVLATAADEIGMRISIYPQPAHRWMVALVAGATQAAIKRGPAPHRRGD